MKKQTTLLTISLIILLIIGFFGWNILKSYNQLEFANGDVITDIRLPNQTNNIISLYSLRGNIVLVQFWASWCGPCRMENRELVNLYSKFNEVEMKDGGTFKIFSISVDENIDAWKVAIVKDNMIWKNHVFDIEGQVAKNFNVHSIPTTFLLDQTGMIIGVNISPMQLESVLEKRIK